MLFCFFFCYFLIGGWEGLFKMGQATPHSVPQFPHL